MILSCAMPRGVEVLLPALLTTDPVEEAPLRIPPASSPSNSFRSWLTVVPLGLGPALPAGLCVVLRGVEVPEADGVAPFFAARQRDR